MNFFEHQRERQRNTALLVVLFVFSVVATIFIANLATGFLAQFGDLRSLFIQDRHSIYLQRRNDVLLVYPFWNRHVIFWTTMATLSVIFGGSLYMWNVLSAGGHAVALRLGGKRVDLQPTDIDESKLRNVVEEMAIAAGTPVPKIFVLEGEEGINAFAAGYAPSDTVVAVTRGSLQQLSRDELQGVIAHEFSHILHGDVRLNMRLLAVLHGILLIGLTGRVILRLTSEGNRGSRRRGGNGIFAFFAFGLALTIIGYIGVFFGTLIKAAVSRQREFLADASAVQFTRNPGDSVEPFEKSVGFRELGGFTIPMLKK